MIALRYLRSRKRRRTASFTALVSMGGVAVGVMALLVVLSVMSGFHADLRNKILGAGTHLMIASDEPLTDYEPMIGAIHNASNVTSASPYVLGQVLVSSETKAQGVTLRGVDPVREIKTTDLETKMIEGSLSNLSNQYTDSDSQANDEGSLSALSQGDSTLSQGDHNIEVEGALPPLDGIVLGMELASRLGVYVGDTVKVISPFAGYGPMGNLPKVKRFAIVGIFEVGMFEYDSNLVLTALAPAADFLEMPEGSISGFEVRLGDVYKARATGDEIVSSLGGRGLRPRDWQSMNKNLFSALKLERLAMFVILVLIVLVAAFNIVSTQVMGVIEKEREIAILKAMGASDASVMQIFMAQGLVIGLAGTLIGVIAGFGLSYMIGVHHIIRMPSDVYYLAHLPAKMDAMDFVIVPVASVLISFLATIYPARQAARVNPVDPLRYE